MFIGVVQDIRILILSVPPLAFTDAESVLLFFTNTVPLLYRTLAEHNFPQFPETLHYLYKLSVEGPRRTEEGVITVIFLTEVSFIGRQ